MSPLPDCKCAKSKSIALFVDLVFSSSDLRPAADFVIETVESEATLNCNNMTSLFPDAVWNFLPIKSKNPNEKKKNDKKLMSQEEKQ